MSAIRRFALRSALAFPAILMLSACTPRETVAASKPITQMPEQPAAYSGLMLKPGQAGMLDDSAKLHYLRVINDSRCPQDAQCVWAGEVNIELMLESGKGNQTFTMKDDRKAVKVLDYSIELTWVDRNHLIQVKHTKH